MISNPTIECERMAYQELHSVLKEKHLGKFVAIYHGEMVDYDCDAALLRERVCVMYPDEYVLITRVQEEAVRTIYVRSPRLMRDL